VRLGGSTLLQRALALAPHFAEAFLVGDDAGAYTTTVRRAPDLLPGGGAPVGLLSAVAAARTPLVLISPCDAVGLSFEAAQALFRALDSAHDAACFVDHTGKLQPFPGLYRAACAEKLRAAHVSGGSVYALLDALTLTRVPLPDAAWAKDALRNVNTWEDARALGVDDLGSQ
jgi:molybdopterin-guanine dinucleotide biosynthesis protein A